MQKIFEFNNQSIGFITSDKLERYTKVVEWDSGYLVVMAKYREMLEVEEYIDLIPILNMLYYDTETFLKPIREVKIYEEDQKKEGVHKVVFENRMTLLQHT